MRAGSREDAIARAKAMVVEDWSRGVYADLKENPIVAVTDAQRIGFWKWLRPERAGYIFHPGK
ncbi:MAG: hypothetical protein ABI423_01620 [Burkholderiales bacterium]